MTINPNAEATAPNAKRAAINNALIWAAINIIIFLLIYYAAPSLMGNFAYGLIQLAIGIGLAIYFTLDLRRKAGGYWSFREALSNIFIMFIVQVVVVTLFTTAFAKWIEPSYADTMREISLNATTRMAETLSSDQDQIDKIIEEAEKSIEKQVNPGFMDVVQGLAIAAIFYFVGALIFAAIFKRERPVFAPVTEEGEEEV
ncbi:DUF4199 domain-containing protein [Parapedobacter lycopersici]|uniref:DUF4199 domain-containing protein n=1 Tax=Parapedobacter lycopersici TaxID=1864939 RepID=UPI00214D352C|nr:DUF4199 domain-containing protein [Parapedobacter lycopersici]